MAPFFIQLPAEIHRLILNHLELHDVYCLARTCRSMWSGPAYRNWNQELTDRTVANQFWKRVGLTAMREHWLCTACHRLHPVQAWSARPDIRDEPETWELTGMLTCSFVDNDGCSGEASLDLALEYSLRDSRNVIDLEPREDTRWTAMSNGTWAEAKVRSAPRIINGKFVVYNSWDYTDPELEASMPLEMTVCPHIGHEHQVDKKWVPERLRNFAAFERLAGRALDAPGTEQMVNCGECLADYLVVVESGTSTFRTCTWADLTVGWSSPTSWVWGAEPLELGEVRRMYEGA